MARPRPPRPPERWSGPSLVLGARLADKQRDKALHPIDTLAFFGLAPGQTAVEMWPGAGWWTGILGPYLTANKGKLYGATFETPNPDDPAAGPVVDAYRKMIADKPDVYGAVSITAFGPHSGMLAPAGTADLSPVLRPRPLDGGGAGGKGVPRRVSRR